MFTGGTGESRRLVSTVHMLVRGAVTVLLLDVLTEAWSDTLFGHGWIKTAKNALYLVVLGLTVVAARPHRRWREFARPPGTFGGVVALETDPGWNRNPRLGPAGFDLRGFSGKTVDSFWLHLIIELGTVGLIAYLLWLWLLVRPLLSARADPFVQCGVASVAFVVVIGLFSLSPEGPFVPALLSAALGFGWKRGAAEVGRGREVAPAESPIGVLSSSGSPAAACCAG